MRKPKLVPRALGVLAVPLLLAGTDAGLAPAVLAAAWTGPAGGASFAIQGELLGVAAFSASNAWAVGEAVGARPMTLIEHWNRVAWTRE